ncbi:MAG: TolC family protein [Gemmatimonadaceae bacterium]
MRVARLLVTLGALALPLASGAQGRPVTRADAIGSAIARGPRLAAVRADSSAAGARVAFARQLENPSLSVDHSRDTPHQHYALDVPLFAPGQRALGVRSADAMLDAAVLRTAFEREAVALDVDTTYTWALVARERARLSARSAADADSLVTLARVRRDAGDASELDVQLAMLSAGQFANGAALDSLDALRALIAVQAAMGLDVRDVAIALADSLDTGAGDLTGDIDRTGVPLLVSAAQSDLEAADLALRLERKRVWLAPSLALGYERNDPGGSGNRILPTIGLSFPLPLLHRNRASILLASADRDRARAELLRMQVELAAALAAGARELETARVRLTRTQALLGAAERVASLALLAYREGASALPSVLEAQRSSRETRLQYLEALGAMRSVAARQRLLTLTSQRALR